MIFINVCSCTSDQDSELANHRKDPSTAVVAAQLVPQHEGNVMASGVVHANIDHYLSLLTSLGLSERNRDTITKLMIAEEDKLGHDLEQLEFAEERAARSRDRVNYLRRLRDAFAEGSTERAQADRTVANSEAIHQLVEEFRRRLCESVNAGRL